MFLTRPVEMPESPPQWNTTRFVPDPLESLLERFDAWADSLGHEANRPGTTKNAKKRQMLRRSVVLQARRVIEQEAQRRA